MTIKPQQLKQELQHFHGDLERYRHSLNPTVIYTPGVKFLADKAEAHWLIDAIASYYGSSVMERAIEKDERLASLQFWKLRVNEDQTAILTMNADSDCEPAITQKIPYTDFPLDCIDIWSGYDGKHFTLYLPSEH